MATPIMWYFVLKQTDLKPADYQLLQKMAVQTEVELFNEPFDNLCLFTVAEYANFVDALDLAGLTYEATSQRLNRDQLLERFREAT